MLLFLRTHIRPVWGPKTAAHLGILGANPFHISTKVPIFYASPAAAQARFYLYHQLLY